MDERFYVNVRKVMEEKGIYCKPRRKKNFIVNYGEILPIITVTCEVI